MKDFWSDISPLVLILLGLGIGLIILEKIVDLFRKKEPLPEEDEEGEEEF